MNNETDKYIIATVETALDVLEAISDFSNGFTSEYPPLSSHSRHCVIGLAGL